MTTKEVVDKLAECEKAGLHADVYRMFGDSKVIDIQCVPQKDKAHNGGINGRAEGTSQRGTSDVE